MSSLKSFPFTNSTEQEIIQKYEEVLYSRETQIEDLTIELGKVQLKSESLEEINIRLTEEVERLKEVILKKEKIISDELTSKEYIFMRLQDKEKEVDFLNEKLDKGSKTGKSKGNDALSQASNKLSSFAGYLFGSKKENSRKESNNNNESTNNKTITNNLNPQILNEEKKVNSSYLSDKNDDSHEESNEKHEEEKEKKEKVTIIDENCNSQKSVNNNNETITIENVQSKSLSRINEIKNKKKKKKEQSSEHQADDNNQ